MAIQPLSNDDQANPFDVPDEADHWRVQRQGKNRKYEGVYDADGAPLEVAITATVDELRVALADAGEGAGRYRLVAYDEDHKPCLPDDVFGFVVLDEKRRRNAAAVEAETVAATKSAAADANNRDSMNRLHDMMGQIVKELVKDREAEREFMRGAFGKLSDAVATMGKTLAGRSEPMPRVDDSYEPMASDEQVQEATTLVQQLPQIIPHLAPLASAFLDWLRAAAAANPNGVSVSHGANGVSHGNNGVNYGGGNNGAGGSAE
jgi:hypothetical protein